jgi:hypothetical protein
MPEFTEHLAEMLTDPAHLAFEVVTTVILALLAQVVTWPVVLRRIRREHKIIDSEHGVDHNDWFFDSPEDPDQPVPYHLTIQGVTRG